MTVEAARARIESWLAPISDAAPAGDDARYEPLHEEIRNEAAKLDSPTSGLPDWEKIVKDAERLTTTLSKDLLIESYATFGLYQSEGLLGLASGIYLLAESMDRFWEAMHPKVKRIRARVNAVNWLTERLDVALPEHPIGPGDHDAVEALDEAVKRLRSVVSEKFEDSAPGLRPLMDTVQRLKMSLPERAAAPAAPAEAAPAAAAPAEAAPVAPAPAAAAPAAAAPAEAAPAAAAAAKDATPEELVAQVAAEAEKYTAPIPGDSPAGADAKYETAHEELRNDIAALDTPSGSALDWAEVVPRAGGILTDQSKDFLIAAYLGFALWETRELEGLAIGLEVIAQLCEKYWDDGFPPARRIRGRANALSWLLDRIEEPLPNVQLTPAHKVPVAKLEAVVKRFVGVVRDKFEDSAPSVRPLQDNVQRLKMSVPEPAAAAPPPPPPSASKPAAVAKPSPTKPAAAVSLGSAPSAELADPKEVAKFAKAVSKSILDAAKALRESAPQDPNQYLFVRVALVLGSKAPAAQSGTETMVPPPSDQAIKDLETQFGAGSWESLLRKAEITLTGKRYWLDMHRYAALALSNLGPEYAAARQAVIAGTALWVRLFPELLERSFKGGLPFASEATKSWIETEVMPSGGGGGGGGGGGEGAEELAKAGALAAGGKVDEALDLLSGLAFGARSGRARFQAKLAMAKALTGGKTLGAALGIYDGLSSEAEAVDLERWEPELAVEYYRGHLACLKQMKKDAPAGASAEVYRRLCRVDPVVGMKETP